MKNKLPKHFKCTVLLWEWLVNLISPLPTFLFLTLLYVLSWSMLGIHSTYNWNYSDKHFENNELPTYTCKGNSLSYKELLSTCKMVTLKSRRILLQTMLWHGFCYNKYDCPKLGNGLCFIRSSVCLPRTVHRRKVHHIVHIRICRTNTCRYDASSTHTTAS